MQSKNCLEIEFHPGFSESDYILCIVCSGMCVYTCAFDSIEFKYGGWWLCMRGEMIYSPPAGFSNVFKSALVENGYIQGDIL